MVEVAQFTDKSKNASDGLKMEVKICPISPCAVSMNSHRWMLLCGMDLPTATLYRPHRLTRLILCISPAASSKLGKSNFFHNILSLHRARGLMPVISMFMVHQHRATPCASWLSYRCPSRYVTVRYMATLNPPIFRRSLKVSGPPCACNEPIAFD